ncbi:MAG: NAD-dependent epimerase/dehydratase family protein [bacterium]|nr:NAD-dependent epimerase/dehydratase family protein [bacterium]
MRRAEAEAYRGRNVLITGGAGFIGSNLAHWLVSAGARVTIVDSLIPQYGGNLFNLAEIVDRVCLNIADIRDRSSMAYLVQGRDVIFNLAGQTSHLDSMIDPFTDLEINCTAQLSLLEACRHHNPDVVVVYASTRQIYGKPQYLPVDERHLLQPTDVNGINKMAGEWYHILYHHVYDLKTVSLRLTNTYGPRMRVKDARQTFLGVWLRRVIEGEAIEVYGDGEQRRDFNFVDDVVEALLIAGRTGECYGRFFNLGSTEVVSLKELAELLIDINGGGTYRLVPFPADRKRIDIGDYYGDYRAFREATGWEPQVRLREGLSRTLAFYRRHREQYWKRDDSGG